ncbi:MAG: dUTP diphosphatase [Muribaculaceae bacterium]|nr:dUTP diphosphatase [Muribaculaceae bacterium]
MEVKIKRLHPKAVIPAYAKEGDAGLDLTATSRSFDEQGNVVYGTGLAFEIPKGYVGLVFPRSSLSKYGLSMSNHVAVIDSGYRGEVVMKFKPQFQFDKVDGVSLSEKFYNVGDRIAQMIIMPYPHIDFVEVDELSETERADGGYGSTGK